jgi:hypothetical protein
MLYGLVNAANEILRYAEFDGPPPTLAASKGLRWLLVSDTKPTPGEGEVLEGPVVTVGPDVITRVWTARAMTYAERLAACHAARRTAYPPIGDQLDAIMRGFEALSAGEPLPPEVAAWVADCQAVKSAHPKPDAPAP